jgi:tripartite-type tricarboxylate transporter receptor subunit TctC
MTARIYSINLSWKDNYVSFDDSDSMTDYSHGFSAGINRVVEWVKKDGGKQIKVSVTNDDPKIPSLKRVQQIAQAGYTIEDKSHMHTWHGYMDKETQSFVYEWLLTANAERLKVIESEDIQEEKERLASEAYRKTPEARIRRLKAEIHQAEAVTAVIGAQGFHMVTPEERAKQIQELQKELAEVEKELCKNL